MPKIEEAGQPARYEPDFAPEPYAPPHVVGTPWEVVRVFLPHGVAKPAKGYRPIIANAFGGFASTLPFDTIVDPEGGGSAIQRALWAHLEAGGAVIAYGLTGQDTAEYAPGGAKYGDEAYGGIKLPAHVAGQATFDVPGLATPGYDHWTDVGGSLDGGLSTPGDDYPVTSEEVCWVHQYAQARADAWGIDMTRACALGRSSGAAALGHAVFGPDRADPEMQDHRANSTRVPLAYLGASTGWFDAFDQDATWGVPLPFPQEIGGVLDPEALATTLDDTPAIYPREFSYLRAGFRDYSGLGPGVTGAELRAQNGSELAVYVVNIDPDLGLAAATVTQALAFIGSDSTDNRVPALADEIPTATTHPAIMGPLALSRLREVELDGFHTEHSRLVMIDATRDELVGHLDAAGNPAEALVYATEESLDTAGSSIEEDFLEWLEAQYARLDLEEGAEPAPAAPLHPRQEILAAVAAQLVGETVAGSKVYPDREVGFPFASLPALLVNIGDESGERLSQGQNPIYERSVRIEVSAAVAADRSDPQPAGASAGARLDALCLEVENALFADPQLDGAAHDLIYVETRRGLDRDGEHLVAGARILFDVPYREQYPRVDPEPLAQFQKARVVYDFPPTDGLYEAEDLITPEQGGTQA